MLTCTLCCLGRGRPVCRQVQAASDTVRREQTQESMSSKPSEQVPSRPAPRGPFNTGSMDIRTAGATASLCGHDLLTEKTIIIVRHGLTSWNKQSRIQVMPMVACQLWTSHVCKSRHASFERKCFCCSRALQKNLTSHVRERSKQPGFVMHCLECLLIGEHRYSLHDGRQRRHLNAH